jgi:hypothetical protein
MPEVTLQISPQLYQRAQRIARQRHLDVQEVLVDSLVLNEDNRQTSGASPEDEALEEVMWQERKAFEQLHPQLVKRYLGKYVAVMGGEVIDFDADQVALYKRIRQRYPDRFVLIAPVTEQPYEEYVFRSPRLIIE